MNEVEFIQRTLASFEGDTPLSGDLKRVWIRGLTLCRDTPGITLDGALGFRPRQGKRRVWCEVAKQQRAELLQQYCADYHEGISKRAASYIVADGLARRAKGDDQVPPEIIELYDALARLPVKLPTSARQVEKYLSIPLKDRL